MKDRISTYPGRVKLTPVSGQTNVYDMTRADQPTQEGTAFSKANMLTDAVAAAIKTLTGTTVETVNAAFSALTAKLSSVNTLASGKCQIQTGTYTGTGTYGSSNPNSLTFSFTPKLVFLLPLPGKNHTTMPIVWGQSTYTHISHSSAGGSTATTGTVTYSGNTIRWYSSGTTSQHNDSGSTYYYAAIG